MGTILWIILGLAAVVGVGTLIFSRESDPKERAKEAVGAVAGGALLSIGCIIQTILSAIPIAIAILFVLFLLKRHS